MERMVVDADGKESGIRYVACFFDDRNDDDETSERAGFKREGSVHMEVRWNADNKDVILLGTASNVNGMEACPACARC